MFFLRALIISLLSQDWGRPCCLTTRRHVLSIDIFCHFTSKILFYQRRIHMHHPPFKETLAPALWFHYNSPVDRTFAGGKVFEHHGAQNWFVELMRYGLVSFDAVVTNKDFLHYFLLIRDVWNSGADLRKVMRSFNCRPCCCLRWALIFVQTEDLVLVKRERPVAVDIVSWSLDAHFDMHSELAVISSALTKHEACTQKYYKD